MVAPKRVCRFVRLIFKVGVINEFSSVHGSSVRTTLRG